VAVSSPTKNSLSKGKKFMPLGAHLPTSKGFLAALERAQKLGCDCLQIFSKSPRQWNAAPLDLYKAEAFREAWSTHGQAPLVAHDSYLINLAAPDETVLQKSIAAMIDEVQRADTLGCDFLVTHCGAHLCKDKNSDNKKLGEEEGVRRLAQSLEKVLEATPNARVKIALENTCGQGTCLGGPFEHISEVLKTLSTPRLAVCFDTCHAFAFGHDLSTPTGIDATLKNFDETIGLENLAVIHLNDSKGEAGSHLDRHEHIGQGKIGVGGLRYFVNHPRLKTLPMILETPELENMIETNLNAVRELRGEKAIS
jgi:deoxyribonuclease-4